MKKITRNIIFICSLCLFSVAAYAQGPGFDNDVVDQVPIDGGLSALAIAGAAYGVKKLKDMKKNNNK